MKLNNELNPTSTQLNKAGRGKTNYNIEINHLLKGVMVLKKRRAGVTTLLSQLNGRRTEATMWRNAPMLQFNNPGDPPGPGTQQARDPPGPGATARSTRAAGLSALQRQVTNPKYSFKRKL